MDGNKAEASIHQEGSQFIVVEQADDQAELSAAIDEDRDALSLRHSEDSLEHGFISVTKRISARAPGGARFVTRFRNVSTPLRLRV